MTIQKNATGPLLTLISVFFFWGFVAASNDILIPVFKEKLNLEQWQSQLISLAFYVAYTVGSIIYYLLSKALKDDILNKIGYKNGIALGLVISACGTMLFIPAARYESFYIMISGLFIIGLGFSLQQTAANPLAIVMGDPKKGSQRLSLAGGVNNVGTTIGPILLSLAIFGSIGASKNSANMESIKIPYLILGAAFIVVAVLFKFSSIPDRIVASDNEDAVSAGNVDRGGALKYPQLLMGMIAIFLYVGVEVSTASNLPEYMKQYMNTPTERIAPFVSLFWASLMIGRWTSSIGVFNVSKGSGKILHVAMPYMAFGLFLLINKLVNNDITPFYVYGIAILVLIVGDMMSKGNPAKQLLIFSGLGITSLLIGMFTSGMLSVYAFISVGLFCSTLWPCIFTLAISGLGKHRNEGSGFLIMMIMGGGIISWLQGFLAQDSLLGIKMSYTVGVFCFMYLAFYARSVNKILTLQGISFDAKSSAGH